MKTYTYRFQWITALALLFWTSSVFAQTAATEQLSQVLGAHHAWNAPPVSVQITGIATSQAGVSEPVTITATANEDVLIDYGGIRKQIATATALFRVESGRVKPQPTNSGFSQLDVTGLFFLAHLSRRPITVGPATAILLQGSPAKRLKVVNGRIDVHYRQHVVKDEVDVLTGDNGLLIGISRSFYAGGSRFQVTLAVTFSDYRDMNGILLPYRIERYIKGFKVETILVNGYQFNVPVTRSLFDPWR
jgi:hypothetical protein